ncbi:cupin domain-containing protein [Alteromonas sp. ASW11-130]|uniref:cupin domain-containing protein n=1 Tax=Alteromonas sp. ASW11-130 TaxID=3015775 RepID=UPI0022425B35|nr:cupin domain-containing protein [Alteromonas sp. ASW11-130]MCW8090950.1 cupin domain-containing protein [Alteromonas sp. ASW11-130]
MNLNLIITSVAVMCVLTVRAEDDNVQHHTKFTKLGEGKITQYVGRDIHHHVRAGDLESKIALFEETLPPKSLGAPPHRHDNEDEIFIVLKGTVHFLNKDKEIKGDAGTIAALPRGHLHGFWNPYDEPAHLLVVVTPGHFEKFFEAVETAMQNAPNATPEQIGAIIAQETANMNVHVDMSKLPASARELLAPSEN